MEGMEFFAQEARREGTPASPDMTVERDRTIALTAALMLLAGMPIGYLPGSTGDVIALIVVSLISLALMAFFMGRLVPRVRAAGRAAKGGLVLGILAFLSVAVFWLALPFALGAPALALGLEARGAGTDRGRATAAAVLGGIAILGAFILLLVG
jgi:hypothetical protein